MHTGYLKIMEIKKNVKGTLGTYCGNEEGKKGYKRIKERKH